MFMAIIKVTAFNFKKVARYYVRNSTLYCLSEAQEGYHDPPTKKLILLSGGRVEYLVKTRWVLF